MRSARLLLLLLLAALAVGCDSGDAIDPCVADPAGCEPPPPEPDVVAGVDLDALFAMPTAGETAAAVARLGGAPTLSTQTRLVETADDGTRHYLVEGGAGTPSAYAIVRVPPTQTQGLPVVVVFPESRAVSTADFLTAPGYGQIATRWVQMIPVRRGGRATIGDETFATTLDPAPFTDDVDDAIGLLSGLSGVPAANAGRVSAVGFGLGGSHALLAAARSDRFRRVASLAAPADLFADSIRPAVRAALQGEASSRAIPGFETLADEVFVPLRDGEIDEAEARLRLLERSAVSVVPRLPPTLALHGTADDVVPFDHGERLDAALRQLAQGQFGRVDDDHQGLFTDPQAQAAVAAHLTAAAP